MLHADKEALLTDARVRMLTIQQSELNYHVMRCLSLGLQSTLVAALMYNGIIEIDDTAVRGPMLRRAYYMVTYSATFIELVAAFLTTYCCMKGPGLALRGPNGSISVANAALAGEIETAYALFLLGLGLVFPSLWCFTWATRPPMIAVPVSLALLVVALLVAAVAWNTCVRFHLSERDAVAAHYSASDLGSARPPLPPAPPQHQAHGHAMQQSGGVSGGRAQVHFQSAGAASSDDPTADCIADFFRERSPSVTRRPSLRSAACAGAAQPVASLSTHGGAVCGDAVWGGGVCGGGGSSSGSCGCVGSSGADSQAALAIRMRGYLHKLPSSGRGGRWQRRFVTLELGVLRWYAGEAEAQAGARAKGELRLSTRTAFGLSTSEPRELAIVEGARCLVLRPTPAEDLDAWRRAMEAQRDALRAMVP